MPTSGDHKSGDIFFLDWHTDPTQPNLLIQLTGKFLQFPNWVKNDKFMGYICDFGGNSPKWESSTQTNLGFHKTQYNPKIGII